MWACPEAQHHGESQKKEEAANRLRLNELAREELEAKGGNEGNAVDDVPQERRCQPSEKVEEKGQVAYEEKHVEDDQALHRRAKQGNPRHKEEDQPGWLDVEVVYVGSSGSTNDGHGRRDPGGLISGNEPVVPRYGNHHDQADEQDRSGKEQPDSQLGPGEPRQRVQQNRLPCQPRDCERSF